LGDQGFLSTAKQLQDETERQKLLEFAQRADLSIAGLSSEIGEVTILGGSFKVQPGEQISKQFADALKNRKASMPEIKTQHPRYGQKGQQTGMVEFNLKKEESQGTRKFIALSGPLHRTISEESILIVDEFEARLHPHLTREIFQWFHRPIKNNHAQLVVATHDVGLMDPELLRRDQIWFCDKDKEGATSLYSLAEFDSTKVRPTTRFSLHYLQGLLGAVPKLGLVKEPARE
jgi:AAA15 family ATPase/GTPase